MITLHLCLPLHFNILKSYEHLRNSRQIYTEPVTKWSQLYKKHVLLAAIRRKPPEAMHLARAQDSLQGKGVKSGRWGAEPQYQSPICHIHRTSVSLVLDIGVRPFNPLKPTSFRGI
jgi:hypothetical protein